MKCPNCNKEFTLGTVVQRYCSKKMWYTVQKKFWRHPHWGNTHTRINFPSLEAYITYERMCDNE